MQLTMELAADCVKACHGDACQYHLFDHFLDHLGIDPIAEPDRTMFFAELCGFSTVMNANLCRENYESHCEDENA